MWIVRVVVMCLSPNYYVNCSCEMIFTFVSLIQLPPSSDLVYQLYFYPSGLMADVMCKHSCNVETYARARTRARAHTTTRTHAQTQRYKGTFLYSAVSNPWDCSKHFTPGRLAQSNTMSASIAGRRLVVHISISVGNQVLICTAE